MSVTRLTLRRNRGTSKARFASLHGIAVAEMARNAGTRDALNAAELIDITGVAPARDASNEPDVPQPADPKLLPEP